MSSGGRGQLLMPWPNRIRDGRYSFGGRDLQLGLTDPSRGNASHGLARWAAWTRRGAHRHLGVARLPADGADRLPVDARPARPLRPLRRRARRHPDRDEPLPRAGAVRQRRAPLPPGRATRSRTSSCTLPARTRVLVDDRQLPTGTEPVSGAYDFTSPAAYRRRRARRRVRRPRPRGGPGDRDARRSRHRARGRPVGRRAPPLAPALHPAVRGRRVPGSRSSR